MLWLRIFLKLRVLNSPIDINTFFDGCYKKRRTLSRWRLETLLITTHFALYFRYKEKLRVHGLRVMSIVEKTMHRLDNNRKCLQMLKYYGKKHERYL